MLFLGVSLHFENCTSNDVVEEANKWAEQGEWADQAVEKQRPEVEGDQEVEDFGILSVILAFCGCLLGVVYLITGTGFVMHMVNVHATIPQSHILFDYESHYNRQSDTRHKSLLTSV